MLTQNLPSAARDYAASQRLEQQAAIAAVARQWRTMGDDFDASWNRVGPIVGNILQTAQQRVVDDTDTYLSRVLRETDQRDDMLADPVTSNLVGLTGAGFILQDALSIAPIRAKQAVAGGATVYEALTKAGQWLTGVSGTLLSDTGRSAEELGMYARDGGGGFVRMLTPPSCSRCVVQAGKWFRYNQGFERHDECDCRHIPASEGIAGDLTLDPLAYFESLDAAGQVKMMGGIANAQAVRDGADIAQLVNAYRRTDGMRFAQALPIKVRRNRDGTVDKFTTEGTSRRAVAAQQQRALRRNGAPQARLMPQSIARIARDDADRRRLLLLYGWIRDDAATARGRAILVQDRRAERADRARERRAEAASARNAPEAATGDADSGSMPPSRPPVGSFGAEPNPDDRDAFRAYWKRRQDATGVDFKGDVVEPHEVRFVERFVNERGEQIEWIAKSHAAPRKPTNDFVWTSNGGLHVEVKSSLGRPKYSTIATKIRDAMVDAAKRDVVKENFIVDLGDRPLSPTLRSQLAKYNERNPQHPVRRMWVWAQGELIQIAP